MPSLPVRPLFVPALIVALVAGCGGGRSESSSDRTAMATPPAPAAALPSAGAVDTGCRKEGLWQWCSVEDRMERAGVVLTREDVPPPADLFHGDGRAYKVGAGDDRLQVWVYPTTEARQADTEALDSATVSPRGARRSYPVPPLLVTSNNLAALVFSLNERTSERLSLALSAGLPQPRP